MRFIGTRSKEGIALIIPGIKKDMLKRFGVFEKLCNGRESLGKSNKEFVQSNGSSRDEQLVQH
jgi:hypothetical protein